MGIYEKGDIRIKWILLQYVSPSGRRAIEDWRNDLSMAGKADFDIFLRNMLKKTSWSSPDLKGLTGQHLKGFRELRWKSDNGVPHRIGGYFSADNEFVMLIGWTHNQKKYYPPSALDSLITRKKKIRSGEATICEYKVPTGRTA